MKPVTFEQFTVWLADAYEHIYDLVYLRTHPLLDTLFSSGPEATKEKAWQLHHALLNAIQELDPGPQVPTFSREWRRHRLMILHYVDGLTPQAVADQLAISRRHYYREHEGAIDALAHLFWQRVVAEIARQGEPSVNTPLEAAQQTVDEPATVTDRMELMRLEAAHLAQIDQRTHLPDVIERVIVLLSDRAQQRVLVIDNRLSETTPAVWGDRRLIRQLMLGLVGYLINASQHGAITLSAVLKSQRLILSIVVQADSDTADTAGVDAQTPLSDFEQLAALCGALLEHPKRDESARQFRVSFALYAGRRTVLIADDNDDILELFDRYLKPHNYEVITVRVSGEVLPVARQVRPSAIVLDLMMPDQDGWDLMQTLLNHPETQSIPIIVCSVLRQRELALSLGATAFLEKPIAEETLLSILNTLIQGN